MYKINSTEQYTFLKTINDWFECEYVGTPMNPPSQYEDIWKNLKLNGTVKLTAHPLLHPRIIKATKKRKYIDMGFRMFLLEQGKIGILSHSISASVITFVLEIRMNTDFRTRSRPVFSTKDL